MSNTETLWFVCAEAFHIMTVISMTEKKCY